MTYFLSVFSGMGSVGKNQLNYLLTDVLSSSNFLFLKKVRNRMVLALDTNEQSSAPS